MTLFENLHAQYKVRIRQQPQFVRVHPYDHFAVRMKVTRESVSRTFLFYQSSDS